MSASEQRPPRAADGPARSGASGEATADAEDSTAPERAKLVLLALILVAAVANLDLAVANAAQQVPAAPIPDAAAA
jgi:hypothetical protein